MARSTRPGIEFLAAQAIDLPFADGRFDVVLGNFVLAHFAKVETALFDIMRVTRPGGVIGFTTWTDGRDAFTDTWLEFVSTVVPDDLLAADACDKAIPNHDRFTRRAGVEEALLDAGLRHVRTEPMAVRMALRPRRVRRRAHRMGDGAIRPRDARRRGLGVVPASACAPRSPIASPIRCTTAATSCSRSAPRSSELVQIQDTELLGELGADLAPPTRGVLAEEPRPSRRYPSVICDACSPSPSTFLRNSRRRWARPGSVRGSIRATRRTPPGRRGPPRDAR